jgi:predicted Zn finger-like uncharacterized protein
VLITTCVHCQARFRVTPSQLNARQGQVRCGRCSELFNGFVALERFPDDDTGGRLLAAHEAAEITRAGMASAPPRPPDDMPEIETLDAASVPAPAVAAAEDEPESAASEPPELVSSTIPPRRAARAEPDLVLEPPAQPKPPSRAWSFGVVLLACVLLVEVAYAYRGPIAQRYPALRPGMESVCARLQCTVPWSREEGLLKLEDSELLEVPGKPNEIALGARIRNLASVAQEYPYLELTLTDLTGQAALRRVLRPTDYLGRPLGQDEVLPAGVEVALQLRLETPRIKATGYELLLFYP